MCLPARGVARATLPLLTKWIMPRGRNEMAAISREAKNSFTVYE